jgi:glutamine synthetase
VRLEYRSGDLMGNPYLNLAAMLMAGLDGIERGVDPVAEGYGPAETLESGAAHKLPRCLDGALDALEADREFLERGGVFPPSIIDKWIEVKRGEAAAIAGRPHPYEFLLYADS